jgi:arylsulfatase A-like enzyme
MKQTKTAVLILQFLLILLTFQAQAQVPADTARPNIVFIMVDDGRYDEYRMTGAPEWFVAPNIERIAYEGANFSRTYAPTPICGPSRASIYTGLYSHNHKTANNGDDLNDTLPKIQQILKDQGYYTGFIGKYGNGFPAPVEFDFWVDIGDDEMYKNTWIKVNGENVFVSGHITNSFNDYINHFFDSVEVHSDKPFALFFFPLAPHTPNTPRSTDAGLYFDEAMPFPENFSNFAGIYPEYYDEGGSVWVKDSAATENFIMDRFACLIGVDDNVSKIFARLDDLNVTDSTFMVYTSDNGYISGEHKLRAKAIPIEESIHVPLFVRYPEWFDDSIIIENEIIELIDIPKTLLDIAGVPDTFDFQGYSLNDLKEPDTLRHFAYYEYEGSTPDAVFDVPDLRGIRGFDKAYFYSNCDCFTEEFYDFSVDPLQNTNQILNPDYYNDVLLYRSILQNMSLANGDTLPFQVNECKLVGAYEIPDGFDNDCDGLTDDSLDAFIRYYDADNDGFGNSDSTQIVFGELLGFVNNHLDCNDTLNTINPVANEICDGIDNDCDGVIDDADAGVIGQTAWYADIDEDGYGDAATEIISCFAPLGYIAIFGDCNDNTAMITIGGIEICNGMDDDCDGLTDDADADIIGQTLFYADLDADTFGDINNTTTTCFMPLGFTTDTTDCDDLNNAIHPYGVEICNTFDDNCNGLFDDADPLILELSTWYLDADGDDYGDVLFPFESCFMPVGYAGNSDDCNDLLNNVHPFELDICDLIDNDCDILVDEDIIVPSINADGPLVFCKGGIVHLTAQPAISGYAAQWYKNGSPIAGANDFSYAATLSGNYKVSYLAVGGCYAESNVLSVSVINNPKPSISNASASNDVCVNNPVKLSVKNKTGNSFQWYKGAIPIAGATTNKYNATEAGNYKCQQTDAFGCSGTSKVFAVVNNCMDSENPAFITEPIITLYPNPNNGNFNLYINIGNANDEIATVRLFNVVGEQVYEIQMPLEAGMATQSIQLNDVASGIYILETTIDRQQWFQKVMVE